MLTLLLLAVAADPTPQAFTVVNRCPTPTTFVVVNKMPVPTPANDGYTGPAPAGYEWRRLQGEPWKLVAVPAVAAVPTFRTSIYHAGHNCPSCSRPQYIVSGRNADGTHNHTCTSCGTTWRH